MIVDTIYCLTSPRLGTSSSLSSCNMFPHLAGHDGESGQERRPSLPSIRDLFGEHLAQPVNKRPSPFSLSDLGSSLPAESRPISPAESQGSRLSSSMTSPRSAWSQVSGHPDPGHAWTETYSPRRHSDTDSHLLTTPSTSSSHEQFITLPPIQPPYSYSYQDRRASTPYIISSTRRISESHGRSRSTSEAIEIRGSRVSQAALDTSTKRRHTIGSSLSSSPMRFPYPIEHHSSPHTRSSSRNPTPTGPPPASRQSFTNPYPAASIHPSLPRSLQPETGFSPPTSCPPSPPSTVSGDEATTERKKSPAKYQCQYCGKRFNRPSSLKIHHNTHTGEKPYACSFPGCGRHFSVMSNMRRHARIHGDLSPQMHDGSTEDSLDASSTAYSSSSSSHNTPIIPPAALMSSSYSRSHSSSASTSPHHHSTSLPSSSSRSGSRRRPSSVSRPHPHPYRRSWSPSSEEGDSSSER